MPTRRPRGRRRTPKGVLLLFIVLAASIATAVGSATITNTVTLPTTTITTTLPSSSATISVSVSGTVSLSLPATASGTFTATITLPSSTATFTMPTVTLTPSKQRTSSFTLPTRTVTITLPTSEKSDTITVTVPSESVTATFTMPSNSQTPELPSETETLSFTLPSESRTYELTDTVTLPTFSASTSITLPSASESVSVSQTFPTATESLTATVTLPSQTTSATQTMTLPTLTSTLTLPTVTGTATSTMSASETDTSTLPSQTSTATSTLTLPSSSTTMTLPTETESATETFTLPTASSTGTMSSTATISLPSSTDTETMSFTLPSASTSETLSLPSASQTTSLSRTDSMSETETSSASESSSLSATQSSSATATSSITDTETETSTDTRTLSFSDTHQAFNNFTGAILPEKNFVEGQELRIRLQTILGVASFEFEPKSYFNISDQGSLEVRVYSWHAVIKSDCRNYTDPNTAQRPLQQYTGFGMSISDFYWPDNHGVNKTMVGSAFVTITAPSHWVPFVVCYKHTLSPGDQLVFQSWLDGEWQTLSTREGKYAFRANKGHVWYDFPEAPSSGAFVPMRLFNYEALTWNFTSAVNCTPSAPFFTTRWNVTPSRWGSVRELQPDVSMNEPTWTCLRGDTIKLVPAGSPCTFEVTDRTGHPYLGSYTVAPDGSWRPVAAPGLFEGSTQGGVGLFGTRTDNPLLGESPEGDPVTAMFTYDVQKDRFGRPYQEGLVYLQLPAVRWDQGHDPFQAAPEFEICFSSAEQRRIWADLPVNATSPEERPMWRKLTRCLPSTEGCEQSGGQMSFPVRGERIAWTMLDLTPWSWGVIRFSSTADPDMPDLSRQPVIDAGSDYYTQNGGDRWRLVKDTRVHPPRPPIPGRAVVPVGSWAPPGCWLPLLTAEGTAEAGVESPRAGRDLSDDPTRSERYDDLYPVRDAYGLLRLPPEGEHWYVCYRRGGDTVWRVLPFAGDGDAVPRKWRRLGASGYLPGLNPPPETGLVPLVAGHYGSFAEQDLGNATVVWRMNDTRSGTWGPVAIDSLAARLSSENPRSVREEWEWYITPLENVRGTSLRITSPGQPCDAMPDNATDRGGRWWQYEDGGALECWPDELESTPQLCGGSAADQSGLDTVYFYIAVPPEGNYRLCVRRGMLNWKVVPARDMQVSPDGYLLQTTPPSELSIVPSTPQGGVDAAIFVSDPESQLMAGWKGDLLRIAPIEEPCDLTPFRWAGSGGQGLGKPWADWALSLYCPVAGYGTADRSGLSVSPCAEDPVTTGVIKPQGLAEFSIGSGEDADDIVPLDSPFTPGLPYAAGYLSLPPGDPSVPWKICLRSSRTSNWVWKPALLQPPLTYTFNPPDGDVLLAGSMQDFWLQVDDKLAAEMQWPGHFHAKLVPVMPHLMNDNCLTPPASGEGTPFVAMANTFVKDGKRVRFQLEIPVLPGRYRLCAAVNDTTVWRSVEYKVTDNGVRWYAPAGFLPTNLGVSAIGLVKCEPGIHPLGICAPETNTEVFDADPDADAMKVVLWNEPCIYGTHIGLEGGGVDGITDLGPGDGPSHTVEHYVSWPAVPGDNSGRYKVCVKTTLSVQRQSSPLQAGAPTRFWVAVAEAAGLPYQEPYTGNGLRTLPTGVGAWDFASEITPLSNVSTEAPTLVAGAATVFIAGAAGPDPAVTAGFWFLSAAGDEGISPAVAEFKLVSWPQCGGNEEAPCLRLSHCLWSRGSCVDVVGVINCLADGHTTTEGSVCSGGSGPHSASCPSLSKMEWALPDHAPPHSVGAMFHVPPPGRYIVCLRRTRNSPWLWLPWTGGARSFSTVGSELQFDPAGARLTRVARNVTLYDVRYTAQGSLASWCANPATRCQDHWHTEMRHDWVTIVNDTQVCSVERFPSVESGWFPLHPAGDIEVALAEGVKGFSLPPPDATPSGRYRVCVFKLGEPSNPDGTVPAGALVQRGVVYGLMNRAGPNEGNGGGTEFFVTGNVDGLAVYAPDFQHNATTRFLVWQPEYFNYYSSLDTESLIDPANHLSRSALIHAGDLLQLRVQATSDGQRVGAGAFPVTIEVCYGAETWADLMCPSRAFSLEVDPFVMTNDPPPGGCPSTESANYAWPATARTQFLVNGEAIYNLRFMSLCTPRSPEMETFGAGCGIRFLGPEVTGGGQRLASPALWVTVLPRQPDGVLLNLFPVVMSTTLNGTGGCTRCNEVVCHHYDPLCSLSFSATLRGIREYGPSGVVRLTFVESNASAEAKIGTSVPQFADHPWGDEGKFTAKFMPILKDPAAKEVTLPLRLTFTGGGSTIVVLRVTRLPVARVELHSVVPADIPVGTSAGRTPVATWSPRGVDGPGVYGSSEWEAQSGGYLEALVPYEIHYLAHSERPDGSDLLLESLDGWEVSVEFAPETIAGKFNRALTVGPDLDAKTFRLTADAYVRTFTPLTPERVLPGDATPYGAGVPLWRVRFRIFSNEGCTRFIPCRVLIVLRNRHHDFPPVIAGITTPVRVPGNALRIHTEMTSAPVQDGIRVAVEPGTHQGNNGGWLADEFHTGHAFAMLEGAFNVELSDATGTRPAQYPMGPIALKPNRRPENWGAVWNIRPTGPCSPCVVTFHTTGGLGPTSDGPAHEVFNGMMDLTFVDTTERIKCPAVTLVDFSVGAAFTAFFSLPVTAASKDGEPTLWPRWPARIDPAVDLLAADGSVYQGPLKLGQRGAELGSLLGTTMGENGVALFEKLLLEVADSTTAVEPQTLRLRAHVTRPTETGSATLSCETYLELTGSATPPGIRRMSVAVLSGGSTLCPEDSAGLLGCSQIFARTSPPVISIEVQYFRGADEGDLVGDSSDRDVAVRANGRLVVWNCDASQECTSPPETIKSPLPDLQVRGDANVTSTLTQGAATLQFRKYSENGFSAPGGTALLEIVQMNGEGLLMPKPARAVGFEICDTETERGLLPALQAPAPCRAMRLWVLPALGLLERGVTIVDSSLRTGPTVLASGAPGCGPAATLVRLSVAAFHVWGGERYLTYDTPLRFKLRHTAGQTLVKASTPLATETVVTEETVLQPGGTQADILTHEGNSQVEFVFYGLRSQDPVQTGALVVGADYLAPLDEPLPRVASTTRNYRWSAEGTDTYSGFRAVSSPEDDDECPRKRLMPAFRDGYWSYSDRPGLGWGFVTLGAVAVVAGLPFPIQVQVESASTTGRAWSFPPSPVLLVRTIRTGGCNDGGNVVLHEMADAPTDVVRTLFDGEIGTTFVPATGQAAVTRRGQVTLWPVFSEPCQECSLEIALCFQRDSSKLADTDSSCFLNPSPAEIRQGPPVGLRTLRTQTFTVKRALPNSVVVVDQSAPVPEMETGMIRLGEPFSVRLRAVVQFPGNWVLRAPRQVQGALTPTSTLPFLDVEVWATALVQWAPADLSRGDELRYGNGGYLGAGQSVECEVSAYQLATATASPWATRTGVVYWPTPDEITSLRRRKLSPVWQERELRFFFTRPCSQCSVWIHAALKLEGRWAGEWQMQMREYDGYTPGPVLNYRATACDRGKWILAGSPPRTVRRLRPFSVTALRADTNNFPAWSGTLPATVAQVTEGSLVDAPLGGGGGGGELRVTSPLEQSNPPTVRASAGAVTFRASLSRSCFRCAYRFADVIHVLQVISEPARLAVTPVEVPVVLQHDGGTLAYAKSGYWQFSAFVADELGDRAYSAGGPTFVDTLPPYRQVGVPNVSVSLANPTKDRLIGGLRRVWLRFETTVSGWPKDAWVQIVERKSQAEIVHGRAMQNGVPLDSVSESVKANGDCRQSCGLPGTIVVQLSTFPTMEMTMEALVDGKRLPVWELGRSEAPVFRWAPPPSLAIFDEELFESESVVVSGEAVSMRAYALGSPPHSNLPEEEYYITAVPFQSSVTLRFACNAVGSFQLRFRQEAWRTYNWGADIHVPFQLGIADFEVRPTIELPKGDTVGWAACSARLILPPLHSGASYPTYQGYQAQSVPPQYLPFTVVPQKVPQPDQWKWVTSQDTTVLTGFNEVTPVAVGRLHTLRLRAFGTDESDQVVESSARGADLDRLRLEVSPSGCFETAPPNRAVLELSGSTIYWQGHFPAAGPCTISGVFGLPAAASGSPLLDPLPMTAGIPSKLVLLGGPGTYNGYEGLGGLTADKDPAAVTGMMASLTFVVVDTEGNVVKGDHHTAVRVSAIRCYECCLRRYGTACVRPSGDKDSNIPEIVRTVQGAARLELNFPHSTRPSTTSPSEADSGIVTASAPHIPWVFNFTATHSVYGSAVAHSFSSVPASEPLYVVVHAQRLRVSVRFGFGEERSLEPVFEDGGPESDAVPTEPPRWVLGYPFSVRVRSVDLVTPNPNVPVDAEELGSEAVVTFAAVGTPCSNVDREGFTWCSSCNVHGSWLSDGSLLRRTCLSPSHEPPGSSSPAPWGACEPIAPPTCGTPGWIVGSGSPAELALKLNAGEGKWDSIIYEGGATGTTATELQYFQLATDQLWGGKGYFIMLVGMRIDGIDRLEMTGPLIKRKLGCNGDGCEDCAYDSTYRALVCPIEAHPWTEPPPVVPVRGEFGVFYLPERDPWNLNPVVFHDEAPLRGSNSTTFTIEVTVKDKMGNTVDGDDVSTFSIRQICMDPYPSRRERFHLGPVLDHYPASGSPVQYPDPVRDLRTAKGGVARFENFGFHGFCSRVQIVVRCETPREIDTMGLCHGREVRTSIFEVGNAGQTLVAPVYPPQEDAIDYPNPVLQLSLGRGLTCADYNREELEEAVKKSVQFSELIALTGVVVRAACNIPLARVGGGIMGMDYRDDAVCCPNYTSSAPRDAPVEFLPPAVTATLLPPVDTTPAPLPPVDPPALGPGELGGVAGALATMGCPPGLTVEQPQVPEFYVDSAARLNAVRCCGSGADKSGCTSLPGGVCLPAATTFETAEELCAAAELRLCSVEELEQGMCCDPAGTGCGHDGRMVWTSTVVARRGDVSGCSIVTKDDLVASTLAGYDILKMLGTLEGCTLACCSLPECMGFSRARYADPRSPALCWLKKPHPTTALTFSTAYVMHIKGTGTPPIDSAPVGSPMDLFTDPPTTPTVDCSSITETVSCEAEPTCTWENGACASSARCAKDEHVVGGQCVPCPEDSTSSGGDSVSGPDTPCYGCDNVPTKDGQVQGAVQDACGVCGGDGSTCRGCDGAGGVLDPCGRCATTATEPCHSCAVTPTTAVPGLPITRGPHWTFGDQDEGKPGHLLRRGEPCVGGHWWDVLWEPVYDAAAARYWNRTFSYRVGCGGRYDLSSVSCLDGKCPHPSCATSEQTREACETMGCYWQRASIGSGGNCSGELIHDFLCPCIGNTISRCVSQDGCRWTHGTCVAAKVVCGIDTRVRLNQCVPCPLGTSNPAGDDPNAVVNTTCRGCDGTRGGVPYDQCGVCGGDNSTCRGCDGIMHSNTVNDTCGVCGGDGSSCDPEVCAARNGSLSPGVRVVRGPDWKWANQDDGGPGWAVERKDKCEGGYWWTVRWDAHELANRDGWYRVGCDGFFDLSLEKCLQTYCPHPTCQSAPSAEACLTLSGPADAPAELGCSWDGETCSGELYPTNICKCRTSRDDCDMEPACVFHAGKCKIDRCWTPTGRLQCSGANQCQKNSLCEPVTGACPPPTHLPNETACDDGDRETLGDRCLLGECVPLQLCTDNSPLLAELAGSSSGKFDKVFLQGYQEGWTCAEAVRANVDCDFANSVGSVRSICCLSCRLRDLGLGPTATPTATLPPVAASSFASRRLLQAGLGLDTSQGWHLIVEVEVQVDGSKHPDKRAVSPPIFKAVELGFQSPSTPMCEAFPEVCGSLPQLCQDLITSLQAIEQMQIDPTTLTCPVVSTRLPPE
eukprot:Hpha_TRINITY_DN5226_c0_g1::TRINITY_DN5226_c0_g1_i1::g.116645::m.116645